MEVLPLQQATQQLSLTGRRSQIAAVLLFEQNFMAKKTLQWCSTFVRMLACVVQTAVVIKTQLEVQDNRLCNAVTLSDLPDSDEVLCPVWAKCDHKIWMNI